MQRDFSPRKMSDHYKVSQDVKILPPNWGKVDAQEGESRRLLGNNTLPLGVNRVCLGTRFGIKTREIFLESHAFLAWEPQHTHWQSLLTISYSLFFT